MGYTCKISSSKILKFGKYLEVRLSWYYLPDFLIVLKNNVNTILQSKQDIKLYF